MQSSRVAPGRRRSIMALLVPALVLGCRGVSRDRPGTSAKAAFDSSARPVLVTLRRDSLRVVAGAPLDTVRSRIDTAIARLRGTADFDVLAVSPAILALRLRARAPGSATALAQALRAHPLVETSELEELARVP